MASEPVKLASDDEADIILLVARDVAARMGWPSVTTDYSPSSLKSIRWLALRRYGWAGSSAAFVGQLINYFNPGEISRDDLTTLAPYIDDWLNGNPPPFGLPAEYDRRIEFLTAFKQRMVSSGVWPVTVGSEVKPRPAT